VRQPGEFREGDTVQRIERDGKPDWGGGRFEVSYAPEDSHTLFLSGYDSTRRNTGEFTDSAFWSCGAPKYKLIKAIEEKVAEELMA
jgi:hypothetical protein